ncbi:GNAT family N-acetyltransferase [Sporomusa termitida]|uniref:FR47-like protein n=1 Tax=Sporomusa termitida TaxID=2377 RepID=A0A517DQR3_9FIRM|nr:GNAT family N-acetyltransferase [Sporomusa termitida]QDR79690.1 FR47-like protein [Sporomusa termitida]
MLRLLTGGDINEVRLYLERNYLESVVLNGNITRCGLDNNRIDRRCGDYYGYFQAGLLQGIVAFYNLGSVIPHFESPGAVPGFGELLRQRRFEVLAGMKRVVEPLNLALRGHKRILDYEDSNYLLNRESKLPAVPASVRLVNAGEVERSAALGFIVKAYRQGFSRRFNHELAAKLIDDRSPGEDFIFLLEDDVPKAQAMIQVTTNRVSQIGGVYTSESSRQQGFCKILVAELGRRIQQAGKISVLTVRKDNSPAGKAYQAIGFAHYDDYLVIKYGV